MAYRRTEEEKRADELAAEYLRSLLNEPVLPASNPPRTLENNQRYNGARKLPDVELGDRKDINLGN